MKGSKNFHIHFSVAQDDDDDDDANKNVITFVTT
jgi:hypothetical protein